MQAVRTVGKHWREVAKHVPRRTDKQCRERYANVLDPELRLYAEWTPEEDKLLLQAVEEHTKPNGQVKCVLQAPYAILCSSAPMLFSSACMCYTR